VANVERQIVLAVEDDRRVRESMKSLIESAGNVPVMFSSGEEFLRSGSLAAAACVIRCSVASGWNVRSCRGSLYRAAIALRHDRKPSTRPP
jgi:FixJ family two-component response regulator